MLEVFEAHFMPEPMSGCWLWLGAINSPGGYGQFYCNGSKHGRRAHRVSYELYKGPIPDGLYVCHRCDVRVCVNPDHLFLGSHADNLADMARKGRRRGRMVGESNHKAKLTAEQVVAIRRDPRIQIEIARDYGMSQPQIGKIRQGLQWRHVPKRAEDEYATASALGREED